MMKRSLVKQQAASLGAAAPLAAVPGPFPPAASHSTPAVQLLLQRGLSSAAPSANAPRAASAGSAALQLPQVCVSTPESCSVGLSPRTCGMLLLRAGHACFPACFLCTQ
jgi:hypothetical protein